MRSLLAAAAVIAIAAGCTTSGASPSPSAPASPSPSPAATSPAYAYDHSSDALVLRIATDGGLMAPGVIFTRLPEISLMGDGRLITPGAVREIYPGPAVMPLFSTRLSAVQVEALLDAASAAGLLAGDHDYAFGGVADAPTTVFTLNVNGVHRTSAYALGFAPGPGDGLAQAERDARAALSAFAEKASAMTSAGPSSAYVPASLRLRVSPYAVPDGQGQMASRKPWPLASAQPAAIGTQVSLSGVCGVVSGADAAALLAAAAQANALTAWSDRDGIDWSVTIRPMLPDERGCAGDYPAGAVITAGCAASSGPVALPASASLAPGGTLLAVLCSNASTGFAWGDPAISDTAVVSLAGGTALPGAASMPGAPGAQVFTFTAGKTGSSSISIAYARPWESVPAAIVLHIAVTVTAG